MDVIIRNDDTATVRYNGATTDFASTRESWTHSYGSPAIVTVQRYGATVKRGTQYAFRVTFAFGGRISVWPTRNAGDKTGDNANNVALWMWINLPATLADQATGVCTESCQYKPPMPYIWCEGDANCLPTRVDATIFTSSEVAALESACGFSSGDSQRPNTCTNRGSTLEVDCGYLTGSTGVNRAVHKKWPLNKDINNGRHSGCIGGGSFETYVTCPSTHPYAYNPPSLQYCCATANDNTGNVGINAAVPTSGRAAHCEGNNHANCPTPPCYDYQPSLCPGSHPFAYRPPHFDRCCRSPNDDTDNVGINALFPRSGRSNTCRGNSQACITPPCADSPLVNATPQRTFTCPYQWNLAQSQTGANDGVCDTGTCNSNGCTSGSFGTGGAIEDPDCTYGYSVRDIPKIGMSSSVPHQACWDFCTNYVSNGGLRGSRADKCSARRLLANGGQLFCGYKGGRYVSMVDPYYHRCHMFIFPGDATYQDHYNADIMGPDPWQSASGPTGATAFFAGGSSVGPYDNLYMTESPCNTNVVQTCPPDSAELCTASGVTIADAQAACSAFANLPFQVLIDWTGAQMTQLHENVHCTLHPSQSDQYICAVIEGSITKLVGYTITAFDATPVKIDGRYISSTTCSYCAIGTAAEKAHAWDNAPMNRRGTQYVALTFYITNQANPPPRLSLLLLPDPCSVLPPPTSSLSLLCADI